jgi:hypothetical protein
MKILYLKASKQISIIKPDDWVFGSGELDDKVFGILKCDLSEEQVKDFHNNKSFRVNDKEDDIIENKEEDKRDFITEMIKGLYDLEIKSKDNITMGNQQILKEEAIKRFIEQIPEDRKSLVQEKITAIKAIINPIKVVK